MLQFFIIFFLSFCLLMIIVYLAFFLLYYSLFSQQIILMKKCNNFIKTISGISFTKNLVLVEKNPYLKENLKYLVEKNNKNNKNIRIISTNLSLLNDQIKHLHFRKSLSMIKTLKRDIYLYGNSLDQFINEYNKSTKFHQIISHLYLHYFEIYENLRQIYNDAKLIKTIKKIDFLFDQYKDNLLNYEFFGEPSAFIIPFVTREFHSVFKLAFAAVAYSASTLSAFIQSSCISRTEASIASRLVSILVWNTPIELSTVIIQLAHTFSLSSRYLYICL